MLSRKVFEKGLTEIETVFHNFEMTKERADIWYKYSKHLEDSKWEVKIASCIKGCRKIPTLADILDIKGYYRDDTVRPYDKFYEPEEFTHEPISEEVQKQIDRVKANIKMPIK